ncbi:pilus assembly protein (plasmid) [Ensifer adhaerens]|uniref:TadE/TadG family type IV pilus assembly protein n=1 Tax=Ensifer adhaerens TaxID=106592 RepID=UPI001CBD56AA|nr:TadE/TadG family type IV pilus assembly protein [Ensifer adhaerens]MBZ7927151.1 pilus assembly protein [Ensifer adhaerens]UAX98390.1 pilus assembly protein [Ensifer adhaerens]UAY05772.1 pilus assembly protein [Ensifer adhaerens]UAY13150.1 pilus assembly protein [Ensifer adhaerens]
MLHRTIKRFWEDRRGYVIALTLIAMPLLLGVSLIVIDVGRSANLHTDLQSAVDAMALTGARELDGRNDSITRAEAAIERLANTAAFGNGGSGMSLGSYITVAYKAGDDTASTVTVRFLKGIPGDGTFAGDDDDPITAAMITTNPNDAGYAWVTAKNQAMQTIFPVPVGVTRSTINVSADAVAAYRVSACDVTPIFICNPYEPAGNNSATVSEQAAEQLHTKFAAGDLYGTQIELHSTSSSSPGPGNFGFLRTPLGNGASVLAEALATGNPGTCYTKDGLDTETGAKAGPIEDGLNTRFGFYSASFSKAKSDPRYRPAQNVRSAQSQSGGKKCDSYTPVLTGSTIGDVAKAVPLGYGATMTAMGGGKISTGNNWNYNTYWNVAQGGTAPSVTAILSNHSSYPGSGASAPSKPSAYDVYRYELSNPSLLSHASANGEKGTPGTTGQCYSGPALSNYTAGEYGDRREIFSAIVNCGYEASVAHLNGHKATKAIAFARMFLTKPAITDGSERYLSLEMIDITGKGGRGTLDEFLREEAELVR